MCTAHKAMKSQVLGFSNRRAENFELQFTCDCDSQESPSDRLVDGKCTRKLLTDSLDSKVLKFRTSSHSSSTIDILMCR